MSFNFFKLAIMMGSFLGFMKFVSTRTHLLSALISLEFIMLNLVFLYLISSPFDSVAFSMFFLILVVCEGALSLALLINFARLKGNDLSLAISSV